MICNPGFHRGRDSERLMHPAEVVIGEPERIGQFQILPLFREVIGQARDLSRHSSCNEGDRPLDTCEKGKMCLSQLQFVALLRSSDYIT